MTTLQQQARALGDPTRHRIFQYVADSVDGVGVSELTAEFGFNHNAIRQHLAKLVQAGLLVEATVATGARGRPRLHYRVSPAAEGRWGTTGAYERLAVLLAEVISTGDSPEVVGRRAAQQFDISTSPADAAKDMARVMDRLGFEPTVQSKGTRVDIVLGTCPFASAVLANREVVCRLHLGMAEGMADASDGLSVEELVIKDPRRAGCRLKMRTRRTR